MTYEEFIFSETMKLVAAEISNRSYQKSEVTSLFEKYLPEVQSLYSKHAKKQFLIPPKK